MKASSKLLVVSMLAIAMLLSTQFMAAPAKADDTDKGITIGTHVIKAPKVVVTNTSVWRVVYDNEKDFYVDIKDDKLQQTTICLLSRDGKLAEELPEKNIYTDSKPDATAVAIRPVSYDEKGTGYCVDTKGETYIKFGDHSTVITYQNESKIEYKLDWADVNVTLYKKVDGSYSTAVNDIFVFYNESRYKFGAVDSANTNIEAYRYLVESTEPIAGDGYIYQISHPLSETLSEVHLIDFTDICSAEYETANASCVFQPNGNELIVDFNANRSIDPELFYTGTVNITGYSNCTSFLLNATALGYGAACTSPFSENCVSVNVSINVTRTGNWQLENCEIRMNVTSNGSITITNWGNTTISKTNITTNDSSKRTAFVVQVNSNFSVVDSTMSGIGWSVAVNQRGIELNAPVFLIQNNTFYENFCALQLNAGSAGSNISYNTFRNNLGYGGIYILASNTTIFGNTFMNNDVGINCNGVINNRISNNYITNHTNSGISMASCSKTEVSNNLILYQVNNGIVNSGSSYGVTISNNTIFNLSSTAAAGISITSSLNNTMIFDNVVTYVRGNGISVTGLNATIINNTVTDSRVANIVVGSTNTTVANNSLRMIVSAYMIQVTGSSNVIRDNWMDTGGTGIIFSTTTNNTAINNSVNLSSVGIYVFTSTKCSVINNTLTQNNINLYVITGANSNSFSGNYLSAHTSASDGSLEMRNAQNNTFTGDTIDSTTKLTPLLDVRHASSGNVFKDMTIRNGTVIKVGAVNFTNGSTNNILLNVTYINVTEAVSGGSQIIRQWYLDVFANYTNTSAAPNVNITTQNVSGIQLFNVPTNSTGWIVRQNVTQYTNTSGTVVNANNHTITANSSGFINSSVSWNIGAGTASFTAQSGAVFGDWAQNNTRLTLTLAALTFNTPPQVVADMPTNNSIVRGIIFINWSKSDSNNDYLLTNITAWNGTTITIITELPNGTTNYTWDTRANTTDGNYTINITVYENATANLYLNYSMLNITIDNTPPLFGQQYPATNGNFSIYEEPTTLNVTITDIHGIRNATLEFAGTNYTASNSSPTFWQVILPNYTVGTYNYRWWSSDLIGNLNSSEQFNISYYTTVIIIPGGGGGGGGYIFSCGDFKCDSYTYGSETAANCPTDCADSNISVSPTVITKVGKFNLTASTITVYNPNNFLLWVNATIGGADDSYTWSHFAATNTSRQVFSIAANKSVNITILTAVPAGFDDKSFVGSKHFTVFFNTTRHSAKTDYYISFGGYSSFMAALITPEGLTPLGLLVLIALSIIVVLAAIAYFSSNNSERRRKA